jgi:hypothetical protein
MKELIYSNQIASAKIGFNKLKSQIKPYLSFDYDQLFYTMNEKFYSKHGNKFSLTSEQINEIESFLDTLFSQQEKLEVNQVINSLQNFLNNTDWMVIRQIEIGKEIPKNIKLQREDARERINQMRKYL